jgi:hypothetical protein
MLPGLISSICTHLRTRGFLAKEQACHLGHSPSFCLPALGADSLHISFSQPQHSRVLYPYGALLRAPRGLLPLRAIWSMARGIWDCFFPTLQGLIFLGRDSSLFLLSSLRTLISPFTPTLYTVTLERYLLFSFLL